MSEDGKKKTKNPIVKAKLKTGSNIVGIKERKIVDFFKRKREKRNSSSDASVSNSPKKVRASSAMENTISEEAMDAAVSAEEEDCTSDSASNDSVLIDQAIGPENSENLDAILDIFDKKLEEQLKKFRFDTKVLLKESLKGVTTEIQKLTGDLFDLKQENTTMKEEIRQLKKAHESTEEKLRLCELKVSDCEMKTVRLAQHSRKSNIRVFKLPEKAKEDAVEEVAQLLRSKLKVNITRDSIDAAHRLPKTGTKDTPAQVIVKFHRRADKQQVMQNRKLLKGTGISIADDLCPEIAALMNRVRKDTKVSDVWSWQGKVYFKDLKDKKYRIEYGQSVTEVMKKHA